MSSLRQILIIIKYEVLNLASVASPDHVSTDVFVASVERNNRDRAWLGLIENPTVDLYSLARSLVGFSCFCAGVFFTRQVRSSAQLERCLCMVCLV